MMTHVSADHSRKICPVCKIADPQYPQPLLESEPREGPWGSPHDLPRRHRLTCPRCGVFEVEHVVWRDRPSIGLKDQATAIRLSSIIRRETDASGAFGTVLNDRNANELAGPERRHNGPIELIDDLLIMVADRVPFFGEPTLPEHKGAWASRLGLRGRDDLVTLMRQIEPLHLLNALYRPEEQVQFEILLEGWRQIQALRQARGTGRHAFIAMSFSSDLNPVRDAIETAVREAGYVPLRVDGHEFIGGIMDEIIAKIRQSKFVVADFTGNRGGVYYEAGFAAGLGTQVIPLCEEVCLDLGNEEQGLHFDVRHLNFLSWRRDQLPDLAKRLRSRIEAVIGKGPILPAASP